MRARFADKPQRLGVLVSLIFPFLFSALAGAAQSTISTASILGTITDPSGAVVPGAAVTITHTATGQIIRAVTTAAGTYTSGPLRPGGYTIRVQAAGFKTTIAQVTAQVGVTSTANATLQIGPQAVTVTVEAPATLVNSRQVTVQTIVTPQEIDQLPVNGRNFLALAGLQPGVQIQDGVNFDPTKMGFSSVSFAGRFGRTARIEMDGLDISDELTGTTTMNLPASGLQEFQVEQSSLDMSTELTSSGAINLIGKSGSSQFHGETFFAGRWHNAAARIAPRDLPWRRAQWGMNLGGPIVKDKVFFFADWERNRQDLFTPVRLAAPFEALSGGYNGPFREHMLQGRLDWTMSAKWRSFFRVVYNRNTGVGTFLNPNSYSPIGNGNNAASYAAGLDGISGRLTHSLRFGFLRFDNAVTDAVSGSNIVNPAPEAQIVIGGGAYGIFSSGPNYLAPQKTRQHDRQIKYDGSASFSAHTLRYGAGLNDIQGGLFVSLMGLAPLLSAPSLDAATLAFAAGGPFPGGVSNPLNYPASLVVFGNGQGYPTEIRALGLPGGGYHDTRFVAYVGDTWKLKPNLTFIYGLHYVRDSGRSNSDLPRIQALAQFGPGLGNRIRQPNLNFSPIAGLTWDPWRSGKTVIRAGAGVYYENALLGGAMSDRPGRLPRGLFFGTALACPTGSVLLPDGGAMDTSSLCGQPIGSVASQLAAAQRAYQAAVAAAGPQANPSYVGVTLAAGSDSTGNPLLGPNYRSPRSYQMNLGMQRQLGRGTVLSADYVRNVGVGFLLAYDTNHLGDARTPNVPAALNAINATNAAYGCPEGGAGIDCAIASGAAILDYAAWGLDSGRSYLAGFPASYFGLTPEAGAAFPGTNPHLGENQMLFPIGRSVYNALQVRLQQNLEHPWPGVGALALGASYTLSRAVSQALDQDWVNLVTDQRNINHYLGPNGLDRTHQVGLGAVLSFRHNFRMSLAASFASAAPTTLTVPSTGSPGDVFVSDLTGDGTLGDVLSGTNIGSFGRGVKLDKLPQVIANYNRTTAGQLTPAGHALVAAGLFTPAQLLALGATAAAISPPPAGQVANDSFTSTDLQLSYLYRPSRRWEGLTVEPRVAIYNFFNVANYGQLSGVLDGSAGSVNGTTRGLRVNRITLGTGLYGFGAPRMMEWGLKISF